MKKLVMGTMAASVLFSSAAVAQDADYIRKLERRLMAMEQKVFSASPATAGSNTVIADFELRLQQLEEESQRVYGAVEELGHSVETFAKKMEMMSQDFDLRLQDVETELGNVSAVSAQAAKASSVAASVNKSAMEAAMAAKAAAATKEEKAAKVEKTTKNEVKKPVKAAKVNPKVIPENMTPKALYDQARSFLMAASYSDSKAWFKEFLNRHGDHKLSDNVYYWMGEIYLVEKDVEKAVVSFSTGLSKFPKGGKASANLLKMGVAFEKMGKADYAKSSWEKLVHDFPKSAEAPKAKKMLEKLKK